MGKNIFQPIGAPHTWPSCLLILDFMCDLVIFSINLDSAWIEYTADP